MNIDLSYLSAGIHGIIITCSMVGWGCLILYLLNKKNKIDFGLAGILSISFAIFVGGVLNLFSLINQSFLLIFLILGIFWLAIGMANVKINIKKIIYYKQCFKNDKILFIGSILVLFVLFFQYLSIVSVNNFNIHDDFQAYFIFPEKMIQTGSLGNEHYSERRIVSSLGGKSFLDTFVLAGADWKNLRLIDKGVGMLLLLLVVLSYFKKLPKTSNRLKTLLFLTILLAVPPTVNITALYLAAALFLGLLYIYMHDNSLHFSIKRALILSLIISGLISLKSSLIPVAGLFLFVFYATRFFIAEKITRKDLINEFILSILFSFLFLLPWMLAMHQSFDTFLYPLLGNGIHGSAYGTAVKAYSQISVSNLLTLSYQLLRFPFICLSLLFLIFAAMESSRKKTMTLLILTASIVSILIMAFVTAGYGVHRFAWPFVYPVIIYGIIELQKHRDEIIPKLGVKCNLLSILLIMFMLGSGVNSFLSSIKSNIYTIASGLSGPALVSIKPNYATASSSIVAKLTIPEEKDRYREMQMAIPKGETILARLEKSFLLDFNRNQIFIIDCPCGSSPKPGMPFLKGPELLANYLLDQSIKYVAYSYASEAQYTREIFGQLLDPSMNVWFRTDAKNTFDFQDNLMKLYKNRKIIYDDGKNFILDISQPSIITH